MSVFELVLLILAGLLLIMAAMFSVFAASELTKTVFYKTDPKLASAHKWLTWASVVSWIGIVILLIMLVIYINQASKSQSSDMSHTYGIRVFLFFTLVILIAAGVMATTGAIDIQNSRNVKNIKDTGAQNSAITAAVLMLAGAGLIIIAFIVALFNKGSKNSDSKSSDSKKDVNDAKKSGSKTVKSDAEKSSTAEKIKTE